MLFLLQQQNVTKTGTFRQKHTAVCFYVNVYVSVECVWIPHLKKKKKKPGLSYLS